MAVPPLKTEKVPMHYIASLGDISLIALEDVSKSLAAYFIMSTAEGIDMPKDLVLATLLAKKESLDRGNQRFEQLMLDVGKYCDEKLGDSTDQGKTARRNLLYLVAILQRVEDASERINKLVFFARGIPDSESLNALLVAWNELNAIKPGLFKELLLESLLSSDLPGRMGLRRLSTLTEGLENLSRGTGTILDIQHRLEKVEREEHMLVKVVTIIQDAIGSSYGALAGSGERDTIKRIVSIELRHQRVLNGDIPDNLFDVGLRLAKSSLMYMNTLLPIIVSQSDGRLREEFIKDSGLDRLLVEELEEFWCDREKIPQERLVPIRGNV
jgi:uncharacterized protein (TIGR04442 family)